MSVLSFGERWGKRSNLGAFLNMLQEMHGREGGEGFNQRAVLIKGAQTSCVSLNEL